MDTAQEGRSANVDMLIPRSAVSSIVAYFTLSDQRRVYALTLLKLTLPTLPPPCPAAVACALQALCFRLPPTCEAQAL